MTHPSRFALAVAAAFALGACGTHGIGRADRASSLRFSTAMFAAHVSEDVNTTAALASAFPDAFAHEFTAFPGRMKTFNDLFVGD